MRSFVMKNIACILWGAWRRRYLIAVPIFVMPVLGLLIGLFSPKKYESHTTILIQEAAKQNPFLEDLAVAINMKSRMEALNALLHSRHILADVASKMDLIDKETTEEERSIRIAELSRSLGAILVGDDLIKITYRAENPEKMAEVLTLVSRRFVERVIAPQRTAIRNSEAFLEKELESRKKELGEAESRLAKYKSRYASELPNLHASNAGRLGHLWEALAERRTALDGARAAGESLRSRLSHTNPVVGRLEEAIVEILSKLAVLRSRYTDQHTQVQAAMRMLKSLEEERAKTIQASQIRGSENLERLWNMASSTQVSKDGATQPILVSQLQRLQDADAMVRGLEEEVASLENQVTELDARISSYGEHEQRLAELQREIDVKLGIYNDLAKRHQKARVTGALGKSDEAERVKLIDPPFTPVVPSNLPLFVFVLAGLVSGIALGVGLATALELIDTSVRRRDVMARLTDAPVFARIPVLAPPPTHPMTSNEAGGLSHA